MTVKLTPHSLLPFLQGSSKAETVPTRSSTPSSPRPRYSSASSRSAPSSATRTQAWPFLTIASKRWLQSRHHAASRRVKNTCWSLLFCFSLPLERCFQEQAFVLQWFIGKVTFVRWEAKEAIISFDSFCSLRSLPSTCSFFPLIKSPTRAPR